MGFTFAIPNDMTLIVIEEPSENRDRKIKTALFHLDRSKLIESSPYFQRMFTPRWERTENHNPTLRGDTIKAMEVMLGSIHGVDIKPESVSVADVWYTIRACNRYLLDPKKLMNWFARWIKYIHEKQPEMWKDWDVNRQLLFPCLFFDHATAFQHISKRLVYTTPGHITEMAPTDSPSFEPMHMPAIVMQQLTAARGRLRTILQRSLFEDVNVMIDHARCDCAAQNIFSYMRELHRIGVKPLDSDIHKNCVLDILNRLANFDEDKMADRDPWVPTCEACSHSWKRLVGHAQRHVQNYFDGLCLDCMKNQPNENSEYWAFGTPRYEYDGTCRISHGEPTWYFSFMGRRDRSQCRMQPE
ncbi:unnamed protein product [Penicillium egyptiacum]|uniref:BTB domain-containing protein n=1 Tax=Penicillium egyptiacum TaxID=1303716 RepID=A0A9W4KGN1_9EURO|nr:unnamed protein product [Penicillium egyptiacum]